MKMLSARHAEWRSFVRVATDREHALRLAWLDALHAKGKDRHKLIALVLRDTYRAAGHRALTNIQQAIRKAYGPTQGPFDQVDELAAEWAEQHAGELIEGIDTDEQAMIREVIATALREGMSPYETKGVIASMVGLDDRRGKALINYHASLIDDAEYEPEKIQTLTERYASRLLNQRASTIARTETITAANQGQRAGWKAATQHGLIQPGAQRVWIAGGPNECEICADMDGETADLDGQYDDPDNADGPPAHPSCVCTEGLSFDAGDEDEADQESEADDEEADDASVFDEEDDEDDRDEAEA